MPKRYSGIWVDRIAYSPDINIEVYGGDEDVMMVRTLTKGRSQEAQMDNLGFKRVGPEHYINMNGDGVKFLPNGGFVVTDIATNFNPYELLNKINTLQHAIRH